MNANRIYLDGRRVGKTSRNRAAMRMLTSYGYTWDGRQWQKPRTIEVTISAHDVERIKAEWARAAKEPGTVCKLEPYQQVWVNRRGVWLHQIAEPAPSKAEIQRAASILFSLRSRHSNTYESPELMEAAHVLQKLAESEPGPRAAHGTGVPASAADMVAIPLAALEALLSEVRGLPGGHIYEGLCPDEVEGSESRDDECPCCQAIDAAAAAIAAQVKEAA